jgi:ligand-binding sensor domain-containing protein
MKIINAEFLLTLWALLSSPLLAQDFWGPTLGPWADPYVFSLAVDSRDNIFVGSDLYGVFKSTDHGATFLKLSLAVGARALAVSPGGDLYAGSFGSGVYRSSDRGETWTEVNNGLTNKVIRSLATNSLGHIFAGTSGSGVFLSTDGGSNWRQPEGAVRQTNVLSLAVSPSGSVFAGTADAGVFRSTDGGSTWNEVGLDGYRIFSLGCRADGTVFAGTDQLTSALQIFRSRDDGNSWTSLNVPPIPWRGKSYMSTVLAIAFNSSQDVLVAAWQGVARSTDDGNTWMSVSLSSEDSVDYVRSLVVDRSGNILAGTYVQGVYRSRDDGLTWERTFNGFAAVLNVTAIVINSKGDVFAGSYNAGVFRSTNNGSSWVRTTERTVLCLATNSAGDLFAGTQYAGVLRSTNEGESWQQVNTGLSNSYVQCLVTNTKGDIFAGTYGGGIFRSVDNGENWVEVNNGLTNAGLYVWSFVINSDGHIFAGTGGGPPGGSSVFRSTDNGANWSELLGSPFSRALAIDSSGHIFAGGDYYPGHVFRSTNNGRSWSPVMTSGLNEAVLSLAVNRAGVIFAAGAGVFYSPDQGDTWTRVNSGSTNGALSLAIDAAGYLLAGGSGVFRSAQSTTSTAPPTAPALALPTDGANNVYTSPILKWNTTSVATAFRLQVSTNLDFSATASDRSGITTTSSGVPGLASSTTYYWRVLATNAQKTGDWSTTRRFRTGTGERVAPSLISPANGATGIAPWPGDFRAPTYRWNEAGGADSYQLQVSASAGFSSTALDVDGIRDTSYHFGRDLAEYTTYYWRVNAKYLDGLSDWSSIWSFTTLGGAVSVQHVNDLIPKQYSLMQNYPNPFNPSTTIEFAMPKSAYVTLRVYDVLGRQIAELVNERLEPGTYNTPWDARGLASGVYFYRLSAGDPSARSSTEAHSKSSGQSFVQTKKLLLLR